MTSLPSIAMLMTMVCLQLLTQPGLAAELTQHADPRITVKLVELIHKKAYDDVSKELQRANMDVNQPTPSGKLPLIEAVKSGELRLVEAIVQAEAIVKVKEPGTGVTPILTAFQLNLPEVARLLFAYGADPKVQSKNGKSAVDFLSSSNELKALYELWEKDGAMAFEDPPGSWHKAADGDKGFFWHNIKTEKAQWRLPPSCGWQRIDYQDGPAKFENFVTEQVVFRTPRPLQWSKVRVKGEELWWHWTAQVTQREDPDEMPRYLIEEAEKNINIRWYNPKTKEFSWEDPKVRTHWRKVTGDEGTYYYNVQTAATQWEVPVELAWEKHEHENGEPFWHNKHTGESFWHAPEHFEEAWVRDDTDL